jgi:hypothetical protein
MPSGALPQAFTFCAVGAGRGGFDTVKAAAGRAQRRCGAGPAWLSTCALEGLIWNLSFDQFRQQR